MQTAGDLVSPAAEFTAGMKSGQGRFQGGLTRFRMDFYRETAPVIDDGSGPVLIQGDGNLIA
jgi:hypothetical protein